MTTPIGTAQLPFTAVVTTLFRADPCCVLLLTLGGLWAYQRGIVVRDGDGPGANVTTPIGATASLLGAVGVGRTLLFAQASSIRVKGRTGIKLLLR